MFLAKISPSKLRSIHLTPDKCIVAPHNEVNTTLTLASSISACTHTSSGTTHSSCSFNYRASNTGFDELYDTGNNEVETTIWDWIGLMVVLWLMPWKNCSLRYSSCELFCYEDAIVFFVVCWYCKDSVFEFCPHKGNLEGFGCVFFDGEVDWHLWYFTANIFVLHNFLAIVCCLIQRSQWSQATIQIHQK